MAIKVPPALYTLKWDPDADPVWPGYPFPPEDPAPAPVHLGASAGPKGLNLSIMQDPAFKKAQVVLEKGYDIQSQAYTYTLYLAPAGFNVVVSAQVVHGALGGGVLPMVKSKLSEQVYDWIKDELAAAFENIPKP